MRKGNYNLKERKSENTKQNWKKVLNDSKNHTHIDELKKCRLMLPKYRIYHKINNHKKMQSWCWLFQTKPKREREDQKPQENIATYKGGKIGNAQKRLKRRENIKI
jgi:hypothetical protein